ncbi:MAG: substrate-binding domain-containing protein, partial [Flavobacterium sp.]
GYTKALLDNAIPFDDQLIIKIEDVDTCEITISQLLEDKAIDAVFAVNELFAVTILKTAHKIGLNVPKDLAIIAFTDGIISKYSTPTITTVSQSGAKMGKKAAEMLIQRLETEEHEEEDESYTTEIIETHLIERESTD